MAIIFMEGFDDSDLATFAGNQESTPNTDTSYLARKHSLTSGLVTGMVKSPGTSYTSTIVQNGRYGSGNTLSFPRLGGAPPSLDPYITTGGGIPVRYLLRLTTEVSNLIIGWAARCVETASASVPFFYVSPTATVSPSAGIYFQTVSSMNNTSNNAFNIMTGNGTILYTTAETESFDVGIWNYWELNIVSGNPSTVILRKNGVVVFETTSGPSIAPLKYVAWGSLRSGVFDNTRSLYIDDIYMVDNSDGQGFLGEVRVTSLTPTSDVQAEFTPLSGTSNFEMVDELGYDGNTTYVTSSTDGATDIYGMSNLVYTPQTIYALRNTYFAQATSSPIYAQSVIETNGSTEIGPILGVGASRYDPIMQMYEKNPVTNSDWLVSEVNSLNVGFKLNLDGT